MLRQVKFLKQKEKTRTNNLIVFCDKSKFYYDDKNTSDQTLYMFVHMWSYNCNTFIPFFSDLTKQLNRHAMLRL